MRKLNVKKLSEYNSIPEGLPMLEEIWAKLTGSDKEFTLAEFQAAINKAVAQ